MAATNDTLSNLTIELASGLEPLGTAFSSPGRFKLLLQALGWNADGITALPASVTNLVQGIVTLTTRLDEVVGRLEAGQDVPAGTVREVFNVVQRVLNGINELQNAAGWPAQLVNANFLQLFPRQLTDYLLVNYLLQRQPKIGHLLAVLGLIRVRFEKGTGARIDHFSYALALEDLPKLHDNPTVLFGNAYGWGTDAFDPAMLFTHLQNLFTAYGAHLTIETIPVAKLGAFGTPPAPETIPPRALKASLFDFVEGGTRLKAGIGLFKLEKDGASRPGLALLPFAEGNFQERVEILEKLFFKVDASLAVQGGVGIGWRPDENLRIIAGFDTDAPASQASGVLKLILANEDRAGQPIVLVGSQTGSRVEYKALSLVGGVALSTGNQPTLFVEAELKEGKIAITAGEGDGFLQKILPEGGIAANFDLAVGISSRQGLYFRGSGGLEIVLPTHVSLGPVELENIILALRPAPDRIPLSAGATIRANLGPIKCAVENIGLTASFVIKGDNTGNLGPLDLALQFKPPNGVGLAVDAGVVKGGGYLFFDTDREEYAGALELVFSEWIALRAIGLITTRMPDGAKGFSLLVIITVEFGTGIQLGFGFTLLGVGGLLGLHRTVQVEPLAEGVRTGSTESVMFPQNVIENAPRIISDLRRFFPTVQNQFLVGPMAKIGWGTPTLASISLGIIVEFPNVTLTILGVVKVTLPDERAAVIRLQVNFIGRIEPASKQLWFYAQLFDSRILFLTLEGGMGLLVNWGDNANFVLSVGGFHPQYSPPPLPFPAPPRIAVSLLSQPFARVRVEGYFAVTSNSAQFGAQVEVFFGLSAFSVEGHFSFDALFRFDPFYFTFSLSVSFSVKVFGMGLYSVGFSGLLEGPTPWHIKGEGRISLLFFKISVPFEHTWGERTETQLPTVDVLPLLEQELNALTNWEAVLPAGSGLLVSLRKLGDTAADALVLHPVGHLRISQRKIPLDLVLDKVGSQKPGDVNKVTLAQAGGWQSLGAVQEPFAMGQFKDLDDTKRLSSPGFERQNSGIRVSVAGDQLRTSKAVKRIIRYETVIVDNNYKSGGIRFYKFFRPGYATLYGTLFNHYLAGNAVSQSVLSKSHRIRLQPFEEVVKVQPHQYSVAFTSNNQPMHGGVTQFNSQAAAEDFLRQQLVGNPNMAGNLHVVPNTEISI